MLPTIYVIDFEGQPSYGIVEYGVVGLYDQAKEMGLLQTRICQPQGRIPRADTRLHGVTQQAASSMAPFQEDWEFFAQLRESGVLGAHHAPFEQRLLSSIWPHPRARPDPLAPGSLIQRWGPWIDTLCLYKRYFPNLPSYSLRNLVQYFHLQGLLEQTAAHYVSASRRRYHCAPYDALATGLLVGYLLEHFPGLKEFSTLCLHSQRTSPEDPTPYLPLF